ncbi:NAD(P)-binding protein, partial [Lindgomyces ingoldianus]
FHHDTYSELQLKIKGVSLSGKSAFITGSGTRIGAASALAFAKAGARAVFLSERTASTLQETRNHIKKWCRNTIVQNFIFDISEGPQRIEEIFTEARKISDGKPIDILVNNAADLGLDPNTKFRTVLQAIRNQGPTIINTTSGAAVIDFAPGLSGYGVSKMAALKLFTYLWYEQ